MKSEQQGPVSRERPEAAAECNEDRVRTLAQPEALDSGPCELCVGQEVALKADPPRHTPLTHAGIAPGSARPSAASAFLCNAEARAFLETVDCRATRGLIGCRARSAPRKKQSMNAFCARRKRRQWMGGNT